MAKDGQLTGFFAKLIGQTREGLVVIVVTTALLIILRNLLPIAAVVSITVLFIHAVAHLGHLKVIQQNKASILMVVTALLTTMAVLVLVLAYVLKDPYFLLHLFAGILLLSF